MSIITKLKMPLGDRARYEQAVAKAEQNAADIAYVAIMTDVELPSIEGEEVKDHE